jgi:hypothetical protein
MSQADTPSIGDFNRCIWTATAQTRVALSGTTALCNAALTPGKLYVVCADVAWHMNQGAFTTGPVAATTKDLPLAAYEKIYVWCTTADTDDGVAGITDGSTGFLYVKAVK